MTHSNLPDETREISIRLEKYSDIFSDFDMRPYSKRALSVDFLDEIKRAVFDKDDEGIELILHTPEKERNESHETTIRERLEAHFKRHCYLLLKEKSQVTKLGLGMVVVGVVCMILATFVIYKDPTSDLGLSFLVVFLEPAAWFLLWEGMDQVLFNSKKNNPELLFYKKMMHPKGKVYFKSY